MRILLVEDNPGDVELVRIRLRALCDGSHSLDHAETLAEAIERHRQQPAEVVLLDLNVSDSSGLETIRSFREVHPEVPVVVLTGMDDLETALEALRNGADDYLVKSELAPEVLRRACGYAVERRHALSEIRAALRARDELLQVVSHDLRNHIGTIEVGTRLLRLAATPAEIEKRLVPIERASRTVRRLLEDLVDIAAIEKGALVVAPASTDANRLLEDAFAVFSETAQDRGITLQVQPDEANPPVLADSVRIAQVLGNLIGNAMKFTPRGGTITLTASSGTDAVVLAVSDTGPGIAPADRTRIFDRFFRGARAAVTPGAGLGLAIARGLVEAHGGRIWLDSVEGAGTTFRFSLPRAVPRTAQS